MQREVDDMVSDFVSMIIGEGYVVTETDRYEWVTNQCDGAVYDLPDGQLLDMADEGLEEHGDFTIERSNTVRGALTSLAFYGLEGKTNAAIQSLLEEHDLYAGQHISDSPPYEHEADDEIEDNVWLWKTPEWAVWKEIDELGIWVNVTDDHPPTAIDRLARAIENS